MTNYILLTAMAITTYLIRVIPLTLLNRPIKSVFLHSFLYYVPYVTLATMTFPAIFRVTRHPLAGILAFVIGCVVARIKPNLFLVSACSCLTVFVVEAIIL